VALAQVKTWCLGRKSEIILVVAKCFGAVFRKPAGFLPMPLYAVQKRALTVWACPKGWQRSNLAG